LAPLAGGQKRSATNVSELSMSPPTLGGVVAP
jgi:hypothetical protein